MASPFAGKTQSTPPALELSEPGSPWRVGMALVETELPKAVTEIGQVVWNVTPVHDVAGSETVVPAVL